MLWIDEGEAEMMHGYEMMTGSGIMWFTPIFMFIIPLLLVALAIWLLKAFAKHSSQEAALKLPRKLLDERFAKGEIDREEYRIRRQVLES